MEQVEIDFTKKNTLNEIFIQNMLSGAIKLILGSLFGNSFVPVSIKGSKSDVSSFVNTISKEKKYIDAFNRLGLNNPRTRFSKNNLEKAIKEFESTTGIKWPLK